MDKHTLSIFGGIVVAILVIMAVITFVPNYGNSLEKSLYDTGDKLLDKADIKTFEMIVKTPEHGAIEIKNKEKTQNDNYMVVKGETINFEVTPNNGYVYSKVIVTYGDESFTISPADAQKFIVPESNIEIEVFFIPFE
jgi:hypothetical protein